MSQLTAIPASEILEISPTHKVTLQDEGTPVTDGFFFSSDIEAVEFKASERPLMTGKIDIPLAISMSAAFKLANPQATDRPSRDFRIVMPDREVAPHGDEECAVMPYALYNGIVSLVMRIQEPEDESIFRHDSFWLNIHEPDSPHPISGLLDPTLQVIIKPGEISQDELVSRYTELKQRTGNALERIVNTRVTAAEELS